MLGLDPLPERTPLKAEIKGTLERAEYRVEKVVYQSLPGLYVTGNFYLPKKHAPPLPAILYVCGHSPHPLGAKWSYQDRAAWFAEHGFACLILDTLEFGEVAGIHHGIHDLNLWNWLSLGYTPVGVEVWNAIRGVDYLESRPEVDRTRIGMTGISGGGAVTWFTAAVDERIAAAAPVCSTYTFGSQAAHWVASGQCDCIYFHNTFLEDFPIVGALIAPRPLCIFSGRKDPDFPPDGYHEVFRRVKKIYDLYTDAAGASDRVREVDDDVGHDDIPLFRKEARQWMNRWLKGDSTPLDVEPLPKNQRETPEALACLTKLPADAINYKIHDLFIPVAQTGKWTTLPDWKARRQELVKELREKVFRWFPREKVPFKSRVGPDKTAGWAERYADCKEVFFDTEPGVPIRARLLKPRQLTQRTPLLLYVKRPIDSVYFLDLDELPPVLGRATVIILNPRLTERPVTPFELAEIERSASWTGRTVASMKVWDILRAVEWAAGEEKIPMSSVTVYGKGEMGILGLYAALFDDRIRQVILKDPPESHRQGPALLNVLRVTDIAEVAAAFAPRKLVFLGKIPASFDYARGIYGLHERPQNLTSAGSMPEAMEVWKY
jgi:cephalosporin-C deacetylase-like acetyl esterase